MSKLLLHLDADTSIKALDRLLSETQAEDWSGQIRWLNQWR
ncbi:hypothetical protein [Nostoc sp. ChiVER01]|nr:hypothetical protein [Nostoc sp. ChiVER01]MDZ8226497.1 hypothetical protein [Nostoc sp. ChiVER01]